MNGIIISIITKVDSEPKWGTNNYKSENPMEVKVNRKKIKDKREIENHNF